MLKDRLKEFRKAENLTQRQKANSLNMSVTGYASWEQGLAEPNTTDIKRICTILNITPNDLLDFDKKEYSFKYESNGTKLIHKETFKK